MELPEFVSKADLNIEEEREEVMGCKDSSESTISLEEASMKHHSDTSHAA